MQAGLDDYRGLEGAETIQELRQIADSVRARRIRHISSVAVGGTVAGSLTRMLPLFRELGIEARWDVMRGGEELRELAAVFSDAARGKTTRITAQMTESYRQAVQENARALNLEGDVVFVHDPQAAGLITSRSATSRHWVWCCHTDVSHAHPAFREFLRPLIEQYDAAVFPTPEFAPSLGIPSYIVPSCIDPFSNRNRQLGTAHIGCTLEKYGIDPGRPILAQICQLHGRKDAVEAIAAYKLVRRSADCQLVLVTGEIFEGTEENETLREITELANGDPDLHILVLGGFSDMDVNAVMRAAAVVLECSCRAGLEQTTSEAMWKSRPVVRAGPGGGGRQVINGVTGYRVHSHEEMAQRTLELLRDPELRCAMGRNGRRYVLNNRLLTRQARDFLLLALALDHAREDVVHLY